MRQRARYCMGDSPTRFVKRAANAERDMATAAARLCTVHGSPARMDAEQNPFILLTDDRLDMPPGAAVGGAHPHAGFEIATFVVTGAIDEGDEGYLDEGDVLWTTAGRGLIHGENVIARGATRILQLWFALPEADRWVEPHFDVIRRRDEAPVRREAGATARVYSGASGDARVQRREH